MISLRLRQLKAERMELGSFGFCFGGKDAPDPPDYSGVAAASRENAEYSAQIAREQLAWQKEQWADQQELVSQIIDVSLPLMQAQVEMAKTGMDSYLEFMDMQSDIARETHAQALQDRDRYQRVFQPVEDDLVREAMSYSTEGRKALEAGRAQADVARAQQAQRQQAQQRLIGYGADPSTVAYAGLDAGLGAIQSAAIAGAGNQARQRVDDVGRALRADVINLGRGLPSQVAASYGQALQAGGQGQAGTQAAWQGANQTAGNLANLGSSWQGASSAMGSPTSWLGSSNQAIGQWGNTLNNQFSNQLAAANFSAQNSPLNTIAGLGGMALGGWASGGFLAEGGEVKGPEGRDVVPVQASAGEFVLPEKTVAWLGKKKVYDMIAKAEEESGQKDQEQAHQQMRERAYQAAARGVPQSGATIFASEGASIPKKSTPGYLSRPQYGYKSAMAEQGKAEAAQLAAQRANTRQRVNREITNRAWESKQPSWANAERAPRRNFDVAAAIEAAMSRRAAQRRDRESSTPTPFVPPASVPESMTAGDRFANIVGRRGGVRLTPYDLEGGWI